jgi:multicomponent Na+:H+ antiporter subunit F
VNSPELLGRVLAIDMFVAVSIALIITFSILHKEENLVDVIIVLAILTFLSTVAFSYYYQKHRE